MKDEQVVTQGKHVATTLLAQLILDDIKLIIVLTAWLYVYGEPYMCTTICKRMNA